MSDVSGFITGFSQSLNQYLQLNNQNKAVQNQEIFKNQMAEESKIRTEGRELANQKELKSLDTNMDLAGKSALKAYELTLAGKVDPESAAAIFPEAAGVVKSFASKNGRDPTVEEFKTLIEPLSKRTTEKQPKEFQFKAAGFYKRAAQGQADLAKLEKVFDTTATGNILQKELPNYFKNDDYRKFQQTRDNFITAYLRRDSGAAIAESEYETADRQFFPMPGDSKELLLQKQRNRQGVIDSLKAEAEGKSVDLNIPKESPAVSDTSEGWSITPL